jgi:hypothetical protein
MNVCHKQNDMTDRVKGYTAFTMTEVVIAVFLMLLSLGALLSVFIAAKRNDAGARSQMIALEIARGEAEQLWTNSYSNIVAVTNVILSNTPLAGLQGRMSRSVTAPTNDAFRDIAITVAWIVPNSKVRQVLTNQVMICNTN